MKTEKGRLAGIKEMRGDFLRDSHYFLSLAKDQKLSLGKGA